MIEIGALAINETPTAEDLVSGLRAFNRMIGNWSTQNLLIYAQTEETFSLVGGQAAYLMGPAGDFATTRPKKIDGVSIIVSGNEYPCSLLTEDEWRLIQLKSAASEIPTSVYPVATNPKYSLTFWPIPSAANSAKVYSLKPLSKITDVSVDYVLPDGYDLALVFNFSILLCPSYGRQVTPELAAIATKSLADIKRANIKTKFLSTDSAIRPRRNYNIYSGE